MSNLSEYHQSEEDRFQLLPVELQLQVLSYVPEEELAKSCSRVSKYWMTLSKDSSLWKQLKLHISNDLQQQACCLLLQRCPGLATLTVNTTLPLQQLLQKFSVFRALKELTLEDCSHVNVASCQLLVTTCTEIESLSLRSCERVESGCFDHFANLNKLKNIDLYDCVHVSDTCIDRISSRPESLESVHILECEMVTVEAVQRFVHQRRHQLKILHLQDVEITDEFMEEVGTCSQLGTLKICYYNELSNKTLEALGQLKNLRSLGMYVHKDCISKDAIVLFFLKTQFLRELTLYTFKLDDDMLIIISNSLQYVKNVHLELCSEVTDTGMKHLVHMSRNIVSLSLNRMPGLVGEFLEEVPERLNKLRSLKILECHNIVDTQIENLKARMPHLTVT